MNIAKDAGLPSELSAAPAVTLTDRRARFCGQMQRRAEANSYRGIQSIVAACPEVAERQRRRA